MSKKLTAHFSEHEFACKCGKATCNAVPIKQSFVDKLEKLRVEWGKPLTPTSGSRCAAHNKAVGGARRSQHVLGNAADFFFADEAEKAAFVKLAEKYFKGIGVGVKGVGTVHVDDRTVASRWSYYV